MKSQFSLIAERKLIVVTGKGGAGKSLLSVALAYRLAQMSRKVERNYI